MPFLAQRSFLNADRTKVVAEGSPEAAYFLGVEGDEINAEDAKKYGAKTRTDQKATEAPAEEAPVKEAKK